MDINHQNEGIGTDILNYVKYTHRLDCNAGCKFITVDAYAQSLGFYERNGFKYISDTDRDDDTRLMYYDLMQMSIDSD